MRSMSRLARVALVAAELTGIWLAIGALGRAATPGATLAPDAGLTRGFVADSPAFDAPGAIQPRRSGHHRSNKVAARHAQRPSALAAGGSTEAAPPATPSAPPRAARFRTAAAALPPVGPLVAATMEAVPASSGAQPSALPVARPIIPPAQRASAMPIVLESGSGRVLTLEADAANVFVADPKVAEVRPASANSLFVFGVGPGRTTVAAMDSGGHVLAQFNVTVRQSGYAAGEAEATIARLMPGNRIGVVPQAKGLLLTGSVASAGDAAHAASIAHGFLGEGQAVDNQIAVGAQVQVTLRVRIAEMSRTITRALGVNWSALGTVGRYSLNFLTANTIATGSAAASSILTNGYKGAVDANSIIDALAQDNLVRILAEPNLTAMSGETASFLAGGEFPIPVGVQNNTITIVFKQYGVSLAFVPTVLSDGRINLHVNPEVSQLTTAGAVSMSAGNSTISVPALTVRRASTTVELGSGQSFAIAGLLLRDSTQNDTGLPGLGDVPVLGALFRSDAFQRNESELVIVITPYIVRPVNDTAALSLPTDGMTPAGDLDRILRMRQVSRNDPVASPRIPGQAGFIVQ